MSFAARMAFATASLAILASCAEPKQFSGTAKLQTADDISGAETIVQTTPPPLPPCEFVTRPIRIAIVVDNTGSNSCQDKIGTIQDPLAGLCGTDPLQAGGPPIANGKGFTQRQRAIYETVLRVVEDDKKARAANAAFPGSEIGLASFPSGISIDQLKESVFHSGTGNVLPKLMTNTKDLDANEQFKNDLWNLLSFTHKPAGMTPYATGIKGGHRLLNEGRAANESRAELVLFITDGLPTDEQPSKIIAAKNALGKVPLVILSVFEKGKDVTKQNAPAKKSLQGYWNDPSFNWGHGAENDNFKDFDSYWQALLAIPEKIATQYVPIESQNLKDALDKVLGQYQACEQVSKTPAPN